MSRLRILHVDTGREWRGGQAQVELLVRGLAGRGHVQAVAAPEGPLARRIAAAGAAEAILFSPRADADLPAALLLAARARRFRPDVIHMHDARAHATAWLAAHAARAWCVVSRRVAFAGTGRRPHAWKYRRLPADRWHAISRAVRDELRALGVPAERIAVVPDAVDVAAVGAAVDAARADGRARALRAAWGGEGATHVWGVIAALTAEKGHLVLIEALARARVPGARLVVVGEGPEHERLRSRARALGLHERITWTGRAEDLASPLAALDALIVPSRAEGFGSIALMAQAAGVPIVASAVGGLVDALEDGVTGRLVPADDPGALAAALEELATAPARAHERAARGLVAVARFDVTGICARIEDLYRGIEPT